MSNTLLSVSYLLLSNWEYQIRDKRKMKPISLKDLIWPAKLTKPKKGQTLWTGISLREKLNFSTALSRLSCERR